MNALLIANGQLPPRKLVRSLARSAHLIVCADGGANHARRMNLRPDIILGDLDSLSPSTKIAFKNVPLLHIPSQESTDLEKAIRYCLKQHHKSIVVIGASGGRIDHTMGALGIFKKFRSRATITVIDRVGTLMLVRRQIRLSTSVGQHLSLIPLEKCSGITTRNLKYALKNESLELGVREGTSNEATADTVTISVRRGTLLVYRFHSR